MASTLLAAVLDRKGYIVGDSNASSGLHWLDNPGTPGEASSWSHAGWSNVRCFGFDVRRAADELTVYLAAGNGILEGRSRKRWRVKTDWRVTEVLDVVVAEGSAADVIVCGTAYGPVVSMDLGRTWESRNDGLTEFGTSATYVSSAIAVEGSDRLVIGTEDGLFAADLGGSDRWRRLGPRRASVRCIVADPLNPTRILAATDGDGLLTSSDAGVTWNTRLSGEILYTVCCSPIESGFVACAGIESRIWYSSDAGDTWRSLSAPDSDIGFHAMAFDPDSSQVLWVGTTDAGVFRVDLVSGRWTFAGLADASIRKLAFIDSHVFEKFANGLA